MALTGVTLAYDTKTYTFAEDDETVLKGSLSCDCGKSQLIHLYCDPSFPVLACGSHIEIVAITDGMSPRSM
jgi:hypothetical protein